MFQPEVPDNEIQVVVNPSSSRPLSTDLDPSSLGPWSAGLDSSLSNLGASYLRDKEAMQARLDSMAEVSAKMVEIAHQISIANAKKASVMTKIPAPGKDSVSALLARFFNARGKLYQVHTDRGADIGKRFSWSLKDAATEYEETEKRITDLLYPE
ncbi:PE family protein [Mycobacterium haemophilum]|uniref:PE family protein n=1 Tax=Mycobacterium haemophilum TaxID=29311 RepID=UPI000A712B2C|nr:PE family protein [Mycobacterium haemophilum]MCV7340033.1 PE family protein [Mycobacterium haemophilum DSM 44634]